MTARLVIFDVDGTLVDSQGDIVAAMTSAFDAEGLPIPTRAAILSIVGLSLDVAMAVLAPESPARTLARMVQAYKDSYMEMRKLVGAAESSPLYPGAREALNAFAAMPGVLMGMATGKSKRGLDKLVEAHGLDGLFVTRQVADFHPSKPHPSMILQAMADAGVTPARTVMIGDTSFDMEMAAAAGVPGIGVSWGYHGRDRLGAAQVIVDSFAELAPALDAVWSLPA